MKRWAWAIPVALAVLVYAPALKGELVWDDKIFQLRQMAAIHGAGDVFFPPADIPQWTNAYYRPMVVLTYLLDQLVFGRGATSGPHAAVIAYHALATLFVWMFARQTLRHLPYADWGALAAGAVFAVHPIHTESVCWISGRTDTVAAMFMMASVVLALRYRDRPSPWALILAPVLFLCAALSKEVALSALLVLPVVSFLVPRPPAPRIASRASAPFGSFIPLAGLYVLASVVYFSLRVSAGSTMGSPLDAGAATLIERVAGALAYYLQKVVVPWPQSHFVVELPNARAGVVAVTIVAALVVLGVRSNRRGAPTLLIAVSWFLLTLGPSLAIVMRQFSKTPVAERYLYAPSVGVSLIVGWLLCNSLMRPRWQAAGVAAVTLLIAAYGWGTVMRGFTWQNNVALWTDAAEKAPNEGLPQLELGLAYVDRGDGDAALTHFQTALRVHYNAQGRAIAHSNIGMVLMGQERFDEAEAEFRAALVEQPDYETPLFGIGSVNRIRAEQTRSRTGALDLAALLTARDYFLKAFELNPSYVKALHQLAACENAIATEYLDSGQRALALEMFRSARTHAENLARLDPQTDYGRNGRALVERIDPTMRQLERPGL